MVLEFPRPSYPGDFVSCNLYQSPLGIFFVGMSVPLDIESYILTLPHDGIVADQFYEIVFGPWGYGITADAEFALTIVIEVAGYGPVGLYLQTFIETGSYTFVPTVSAYFDPNAIIRYLAGLDVIITAADFGEISLYFTMAGEDGSSVVIGYGQTPQGTVFALRPVDQTNNDTFRVITTAPEDYAS